MKMKRNGGNDADATIAQLDKAKEGREREMQEAEEATIEGGGLDTK